MRILLISLLIPFAIQCSYGQGKYDRNLQFQKITNFIQSTTDVFNLPGLSIAIVKDNKVAYHKAFGVRNVNIQDSLKSENIFHFASVSKPFVATAVMQLVEKNKISLDDKLTKHLPYFKIDDERYKDITIKQLLNHTSGLGNVHDYEWHKPKYDENASEEYVKSLSKEKLLYAPGTDWAYSNLAYDILGDLVAKVSGLPFETYVKKNIFEPLEMKNTSFIYPEIPENIRTTPHIWKGSIIVSEVYPYNRIHAPSSTLNSNVLEMCNWAIANLNKGQFKNARILNKETYSLLWNNSVNIEKKPSVGLSWFLREYRGTKTISHGGGDLGYRSYFVMLPDSGLAIIIASNYMFSPVDRIAYGILDILLGFEPEPIQQHIGFPLVEIFMAKGIEDATDFYEKIIADSSKCKYYKLDENGFTDVANEADELGLSEGSLFLFEYNVKVHPNSVNAHNSLGQILMKKSRYEEAKKSFKKSLEIDPKDEFANKKLKELDD